MANDDPERDWIEIHLPNHTNEEFQDILSQVDHSAPDSITYTVEPAMDVDPEAQESESMEPLQKGQTDQAWVDFASGHAVIGLNPQWYADTPPDELIEVAEDILQQWANHWREMEQIHEEPEL